MDATIIIVTDEHVQHFRVDGLRMEQNRPMERVYSMYSRESMMVSGATTLTLSGYLKPKVEQKDERR